MSMNLDLYESNTTVFIVKIWIEEIDDEAGQPTWRGHITHVPSQRRGYIQTVHDIPIFIGHYLKAMGVQATGYWMLKRWLCRWLCL